jgi:hypothetical protein
MADILHIGIWSVLEVGVGIIVACCPALRVLLRQAGDGMPGSATRGRNTYVSDRTDSRAPIMPPEGRCQLQEIETGIENVDKMHGITDETIMLRECHLDSVAEEGTRPLSRGTNESDRSIVPKIESTTESTDSDHLHHR